MKTILSLLCVALLSTVAVNAQVQKDVRTITTVKKVRETNDKKITTKVVQDVNSEVDLIEVEDNNMEDQAKKVNKLDADKTEVITSNTSENTSNKMIVAQKMKAQQAELENSKQMQMEAAKKEKMAIEANKKKMMEELEKRKMELQSRPKGMTKLKKKSDNDGIN
jgi:hypothetical protein